ncbi:MAG: hypothetical protein MJ078_03050 [Clostridia bacterium]|nr:hypothetical protein [Clostridia bacterium]
MTTVQTLLKNHPVFWSRLGFCYDPPRQDKDGRPIVFSRDFERYNRIHRDFAGIGVKLHTVILHSGWTADGVYDYRLTDETLEAVFRDNPDILLLPRVKLNVPPDWCKNHPEDTFVYERGPRSAEKIAAAACTLRHDYFGMETDGYLVNGGKNVYRDDRINRGGVIGLQSFSSLQWIKDASETLKRLLAHLASSAYRDRILGVHIAYGMCGETSLWGAWNGKADGRRGDYGIKNRERFREYGVKKYGSPEQARDVWGCFDVPPLSLREKDCTRVADLFLPPDDVTRDYYSFVSESAAEAFIAFCRTVKEEGNRLFGRNLAAGGFYGYTYLPQSANASHLAIDTLLSSPYVDFLCSPKGYYRCLAGDPGGEQGPSESVARKKVWLDEIDNHTYLDFRPEGRAADFAETKTLLWREAVKNLTKNQGFWWMDLREGMYDSPEIMGEIEKITRLGEKLSSVPSRSVAEILLLTDDESLKASRVSHALNARLMYEVHSELKLCGAPVDTFRMSDVLSEDNPLDISGYRMVVFTNCFVLTPAQRDKLKILLQGKTAVWHYAPGVLCPDFDLCNVEKLTGFSVKPLENPPQNFTGLPETAEYTYAENHGERLADFPLLTVESTGGEVIARYPAGEPMAVKKAGSVFAAAPCLTRSDFRKIAEEAGVTLLAPLGVTVYADNRIAGFFPKESLQGKITLPFAPNGSAFVSVPGKGAAVFVNETLPRKE